MVWEIIYFLFFKFINLKFSIMNKKFLSVILFSALMVGSAGMFTSCKDYDDDIKDLQGQLDKKASLEELNSKVTALESSVAEAKTAATVAKTAAEEAKNKAQEALDKAGQGGGVSASELAALKKSFGRCRRILANSNQQDGFFGCCEPENCRFEERTYCRFRY